MANDTTRCRAASIRTVCVGVIALVISAHAAIATCSRDGGKWAGPKFDFGTNFPIPRDKDGDGVEDLYTTNYRVCRLRDNDDLLFIYQQHKDKWHGVGFRRNVGHERVNGRPGRVQQILFPWSAHKWPETPYVAQLIKQKNGWVIVAMDPIRGDNRKKIVRELTTTKKNGDFLFKYKGTYE